MLRQLTAIIEKEDNVDVASQGDTVDEARRNLKEALELFFETASADEISTRLHGEIFITNVEFAVG